MEELAVTGDISSLQAIANKLQEGLMPNFEEALQSVLDNSLFQIFLDHQNDVRPSNYELYKNRAVKYMLQPLVPFLEAVSRDKPVAPVVNLDRNETFLYHPKIPLQLALFPEKSNYTGIVSYSLKLERLNREEGLTGGAVKREVPEKETFFLVLLNILAVNTLKLFAQRETILFNPLKRVCDQKEEEGEHHVFMFQLATTFANKCYEFQKKAYRELRSADKSPLVVTNTTDFAAVLQSLTKLLNSCDYLHVISFMFHYITKQLSAMVEAAAESGSSSLKESHGLQCKKMLTTFPPGATLTNIVNRLKVVYFVNDFYNLFYEAREDEVSIVKVRDMVSRISKMSLGFIMQKINTAKSAAVEFWNAFKQLTRYFFPNNKPRERCTEIESIQVVTQFSLVFVKFYAVAYMVFSNEFTLVEKYMMDRLYKPVSMVLFDLPYLQSEDSPYHIPFTVESNRRLALVQKSVMVNYRVRIRKPGAEYVPKFLEMYYLSLFDSGHSIRQFRENLETEKRKLQAQEEGQRQLVGQLLTTLGITSLDPANVTKWSLASYLAQKAASGAAYVGMTALGYAGSALSAAWRSLITSGNVEHEVELIQKAEQKLPIEKQDQYRAQQRELLEAENKIKETENGIEELENEIQALREEQKRNFLKDVRLDPHFRNSLELFTNYYNAVNPDFNAIAETLQQMKDQSDIRIPDDLLEALENFRPEPLPGPEPGGPGPEPEPRVPRRGRRRGAAAAPRERKEDLEQRARIVAGTDWEEIETYLNKPNRKDRTMATLTTGPYRYMTSDKRTCGTPKAGFLALNAYNSKASCERGYDYFFGRDSYFLQSPNPSFRVFYTENGKMKEVMEKFSTIDPKYNSSDKPELATDLISIFDENPVNYTFLDQIRNVPQRRQTSVVFRVVLTENKKKKADDTIVVVKGTKTPRLMPLHILVLWGKFEKPNFHVLMPITSGGVDIGFTEQ